MSRLMDAAVRLYHQRERLQVERFLNAWGTGESFENTNSTKIWFWACKRWKDFPYREYELREDK